MDAFRVPRTRPAVGVCLFLQRPKRELGAKHAVVRFYTCTLVGGV
jgi:hypothetical protein